LVVKKPATDDAPVLCGRLQSDDGC
jgi:hypothetical protein